MKPGLKKSKQYTLGSGGLPKSLVDRLYYIPEYFDPEKHPLSPFLNEQIIPKPGLDILLLQDFGGYCEKVSPLLQADGVYIATPHCYAPETVIRQYIGVLRKDYGVKTARAALFPNEEVKYAFLIHELLHDVFNNLNDVSRKKLLDSFHAPLKNRGQGDWNPFVYSGLDTCGALHHLDEFIAYFFYYKINFSLGGCSFSKFNPLPERFGKTMRNVGYKI